MAARFTLRDLPLSAKLVLTTFLIAVGVGYFSALVQLHMQHGDRDGEALPTPDNVIEHFSGLKRFNGVFPVSKLEGVVQGDPHGGFTQNNMAPAFFAKSSGYEKEVRERDRETVFAERDGERQALLAWYRLEPAARKQTYDDKAMPLPAKLAGLPITAEYLDKAAGLVNVTQIIEDRCLKCHGEGGDNKPEMDTYAKLEPLVTAPEFKLIDDRWIRSAKQTSVEKLTQSTHAHLLSFAVLFTLTGLTFAFTGYSGVLRGVLGPVVLVAQLADISCWWLARLEGVGPQFAQAILVTGGVVGLGLAAQILLSLFDLYGWRGRAVLLVLGLAAAGGFGVLVVKVIGPALTAERQATVGAKTVEAKTDTKVAKPAKGVDEKVAPPDEGPKIEPAKD